MGVALDLTALLGETLALYWQRCNMLLREPQRCCTRSMGMNSKLHSWIEAASVLKHTSNTIHKLNCYA